MNRNTMTMSPDRSRRRRHGGGSVLERRFILSMALVILLLVGPSAAVVQLRSAAQFRSAAQVRGASMARSIAAVVTPALLAYNYVGLEEAARSAAGDEGITYIVIHDKEGLVAGDSRTIDSEARQSVDGVSMRAAQSRDPLVQEAAVRDAEGRYEQVLDVAVPVYVAGSSEKWGTVRVGVALKPVQQAVLHLTYSIMAIGALGFLLSLLVVRVISRRITRPLSKLREGTTALAQGDLSHRLSIRTGDEIEDLAAHFNNMADEIEARQAEARDARGALEKLNASLEEQVRERTAAHLRSEGKYRTLVEGSPLGIAIVQGGGTAYGNPAFRSIVGDDNRTLFDAMEAGDREALVDRLAAWDRHELLGPHETRLHTAGGQVRFVEMRWMPIDLDGEPADLCLLADVSAIRKLQEQVAVSDKLRALGELASGVAHDFNNCLAIILGRCQLLARKTTDNGILKGLSIIEKAASDGGQTVRRIQDFARMRKDPTQSLHDLGEIVSDIVEITRGKWKDEAEGRGIQIDVDTSFRHTGSISGNAAELREALTNLVINAVDAMPKGGRLGFATSDETIDGANFIRLDVKDTGVGISKEAQAQIFDPFFSTKGNLGTGLGLSITYGIVTRHGGSIGVESTPGQGTTFIIRLPLGTADGAAPEQEQEDAPFIPSTILVVDDEPEIREVLMEGLTDGGYKVTTASGGREAISKLDLVHFDVVMTDLGMPEVTGWDVVEAARARRPNMILGLVTGWGETLDPVKVRDHGISLVVSKPFQMERLLRELRRSIAGRQDKAA
jgi:signal transduction histidine kinase/ActR/RegA family two-component response regulator